MAIDQAKEAQIIGTQEAQPWARRLGAFGASLCFGEDSQLRGMVGKVRDRRIMVAEFGGHRFGRAGLQSQKEIVVGEICRIGMGTPAAMQKEGLAKSERPGMWREE